MVVSKGLAVILSEAMPLTLLPTVLAEKWRLIERLLLFGQIGIIKVSYSNKFRAN